MKITAQEEYGLRILIRIAACSEPEGLTISQLSQAEGLSMNYVAKLTRLLRQEGFIKSTPGKIGGYFLSRPRKDISVNVVLKALGGSLFDDGYCGLHAGLLTVCTNSAECSSRSLWRVLQNQIDRFLDKISLEDLIGNEKNAEKMFRDLLAETAAQKQAETGEQKHAETAAQKQPETIPQSVANHAPSSNNQGASLNNHGAPSQTQPENPASIKLDALAK